MEIDPDKVLTGMDYHPKGHHFNLKRVSQYQPAPTITAMGSAETTAGAFHWIEPRKLTLGELKRIMSLPDDFKLTGKWNQKAERCGRMVPPLMMERIASSIYEKVLEKYNG
jgi:DNA (cytosine-5)-methyltransferase 1